MAKPKIYPRLYVRKARSYAALDGLLWEVRQLNGQWQLPSQGLLRARAVTMERAHFIASALVVRMGPTQQNTAITRSGEGFLHVIQPTASPAASPV